MYLKQIEAKNFRLLHDVQLLLEDQATVIVGRNNSGKTSLTEVMKRLLSDASPSFSLEDFSFCCYDQFWNSHLRKSEGEDEAEIRKILPVIEVRLHFSYEQDEHLGLLSELIVDLEPECTQALAVVRYALKDGKLPELFGDFAETDEDARPDFFRLLRDRIPALYETTFVAVDPNDATNEKVIERSTLRKLCLGGFISAQRGLDDASQKERVVIGKVLENLFSTAKSNTDDTDNHAIAEELEVAVKSIQEKMGDDFNEKLDQLLPALSLFGYPGLNDSKLLTETTLDVAKLLTNHTKVRYTGSDGIHLPEAYNGLGTRNIILILLQLREFFKLYLAMEPRPSVHLVFIEEPEVHLHPQMQEVFIRKITEIASAFNEETGESWPVQFVVSTHSSHVANEAHFETIRYFLASADDNGAMSTKVKDLRKGLAGKPEPDRSFLHQYMTLTRCDLFFADKAILVEGTTERLLLPRIIRMLDRDLAEGKKLSSRYLSVVEVGGAYAHIFFDLVNFLELRTLVITDLDSVKSNGAGKFVACQVSQGQKTSNACLKSWYSNKDITPAELLAVGDAAKTKSRLRLTYQCPEAEAGPCGRSFEDAFMLANPELFPLPGPSDEEKETQAWERAREEKKSAFALTHALSENDWNIPRYIRCGLAWLAEGDPSPVPIPPGDVGAAA
ncbi:ATP-dependent endonuclease [Oleiagrimonas sp. C23AA]|uniref:AAA family ATPase n=1 Tax=Oleiagrimonas sp. C23AA TaxID=2719047 RepID=UPI001422AF66|nr:ATP-dependent endonuclease [Oleiagrimonas sp. C23AA]NII11294.1 AAA family ATPase [Oleiagrimonas sp. C23AA]